MSRPCPSCMAAIKDMGIKHIYYTTNDRCAYENLMQVVKDNKLYAYLNFEKNNTEDKEYFDKLNYNPYVIEL